VGVGDGGKEGVGEGPGGTIRSGKKVNKILLMRPLSSTISSETDNLHVPVQVKLSVRKENELK
jgi:hypothetical protein